ncbi:MAG: hypothetical protein NT007_09860 [Candidatus Kapabacteria bacterium]|nr:hypothetical protein [Candidatus Kapabacteria bacterium]
MMPKDELSFVFVDYGAQYDKPKPELSHLSRENYNRFVKVKNEIVTEQRKLRDEVFKHEPHKPQWVLKLKTDGIKRLIMLMSASSATAAGLEVLFTKSNLTENSASTMLISVG